MCTKDVWAIFCEDVLLPLSWWLNGLASFTVKKLECSKQAFAVNTLAWNNRIGLVPILLVCEGRVMIKRDGWGHLYSGVRGEILGLPEDKPLRKRLPRTFSLIKNESKGIEDDQIPS